MLQGNTFLWGCGHISSPLPYITRVLIMCWKGWCLSEQEKVAWSSRALLRVFRSLEALTQPFAKSIA
jgi:hypothetical protein